MKSAPATVTPGTTMQRCVIIGGGFAGQETARQFVKQGAKSVTIVQGNSFSEQPITMPYFITRPNLYESTAHTAKGAVAALDYLSIAGVNYVVGTVVDVNEHSLVFDDERKLTFDILVIAVGIHYPVLTARLGEDLATRTEFVHAFPAKVAAATRILVGGGGPVAMEMASECRRLNPGAVVTVVTSASHVMDSWKGRAQAAVAGRLKAKNIDVICNERLEAKSADTDILQACFETAAYTLARSDRAIEADLYLPYFASAHQVSPEKFDRGGRVIVNEHGQSPTRPNIFAVGCGDQAKVSIMPVMEKEAKMVAANAMSLQRGDSPRARMPTSTPAVPAAVHLGLGSWSAVNLTGLPGVFARCCGCFNPLCPCCACCGWPCLFPASELQGRVFGNIIIGSIGNMHKPHKPLAPELQKMD